VLSSTGIVIVLTHVLPAAGYTPPVVGYVSTTVNLDVYPYNTLSNLDNDNPFPE
jgi:hypothetical protein